MSDTENVSVEVRELLKLVLQEPVDSDTNDTSDTLSPNKEATVSVPKVSDQSLDIQTEIAITSAVELPRKDVPIVNENIHSHANPDLRAIESNALKLIAQYRSDSDSSDDTESSGEVVAIDDVELVLQNTLAAGNYRVVSSDSEEDSSSSYDSDVEMISVQNEIITVDDDDVEDSDTKSRGPIRVEGEFTIDSLPPIEDLKISVPEDECVVLGKGMSIVDQLGKITYHRTIDRHRTDERTRFL